MSDPFMDLIEAERFEKRLATLSKASPKEKAKARQRLEQRERKFAEDHAETSWQISQEREFEEEASADENWNHDQPL